MIVGSVSLSICLHEITEWYVIKIIINDLYIRGIMRKNQ